MILTAVGNNSPRSVMLRDTYLVGSDPVGEGFLDAIPCNLAHYQVWKSRLQCHE